MRFDVSTALRWAVALLFTTSVAVMQGCVPVAALHAASPSAPTYAFPLAMETTQDIVEEGMINTCGQYFDATGLRFLNNCSSGKYGYYSTLYRLDIHMSYVYYPIDGKTVCFPTALPPQIPPFKPMSLSGMDFIREVSYVDRGGRRSRGNMWRVVTGRYFTIIVTKADGDEGVLSQDMYGVHYDVDFRYGDAEGVLPSEHLFDIPEACNTTMSAGTTSSFEQASDGTSSYTLSGTPIPHPQSYYAQLAQQQQRHGKPSHGALPTEAQLARLTARITHVGLPASVDSRPYVTPVRNQGLCGDCWAFATSATAETVWRIAHNVTSNGSDFQAWLAPQVLVDCVHGNMNGTAPIYTRGCLAGWPAAAIAFMAANGTMYESDYRYMGVNGAHCKLPPPHSSTTRGAAMSLAENRPLPLGLNNDRRHAAAAAAAVVKPIAGGYMIPPFRADLMQAAVAEYGAIITIVNQAPMNGFSGRGVYNDSSCNPQQLDHVVSIVGYGEEVMTKSSGGGGGEEATATPAVVPYWIIKNSFGSAWGDSGYLRVIRGFNRCGVESYAFVVEPSV